MPLIHSYQYGLGGLADFLRSVYAYYVYCHLNEIPYFLYIENHPFSICFKMKEIPEEYKKDLNVFQDIGSSSSEKTKTILNSIKKDNCIVFSNIFDFVSFEDLKKYRNDFIKFLDLTEPVTSRINFLLNFYNLNEFNSIHIRMGDQLMSQVNIASDIRVRPSELQKKVLIAVEFLRPKSRPIVLFTDNKELKNILIKDKTDKSSADIIVMKTQIHHTALQSVDIISTIDTIAEFFIMGLSNEIVTLSSSGFSFWSSFIFNRDLYQIVDNRVSVFKESDLKYK